MEPYMILNFLGVLLNLFGKTFSTNYKIDFAVDYFTMNGLSLVTSVVCCDDDNIRMYKKLSKRGILMSNFDPKIVKRYTALSQLSSKNRKIGILLDLGCDGAEDVLQFATQNDLFIQSKSSTKWLITLEDHVPRDTINSRADAYEPEMSDPMEYLTEPYHNTNNSDHLLMINQRFNSEFIGKYGNRSKPKTRQQHPNISAIDVILPLNILLDNDVILAVPDLGKNTKIYNLYKMEKITRESKSKIISCGAVFAFGDELSIKMYADNTWKTSLKGSLLRGVTAIYNLEKFKSLDDLSTRETDTWAKMTYSIFRILEEDLHFRTIIRFFDDYGWKKNKSFTAMVGHLEQRKADLSVAGVLFRRDRFAVVDYTDSLFRLQTGILFREPSISSVTNMFVLPFSTAVWISLSGLIIFFMIAFQCEIAAGKRFKWIDGDIRISEIVLIVLSIIGQQGYHSPPISATGRLIFFLLLFFCLAMFTSYSAKIVDVMQAPSTSITSIKDITDSNFEVGIQANLPLFDVELKEAVPVHKTIGEFYRKKISGKRGGVYFQPKNGIEKIKCGLFAFEVELTSGYKLISETYEEIEKCGLREIDMFPKPFLGTALQKHSPFKELFTKRLKWQTETGLVAREWKRWVPQRPKCEAKRIGFISVGVTEFYPAIILFLFGIMAAACVFLMENLWSRAFRICKRKNSVIL